MKRPSNLDIHCSDIPALIVSHGGTGRKVRGLTQDVTVIGRATSCDIGIESRDVADVHCVICRTREGYRVRNYATRGVTRVNGDNFQERLLANGDVLQVGTFYFRVQLPGWVTTAAKIEHEPGAINRVLRSRQRLGQMAVKLRHHLRVARAARAEMTAEADAARAALRQARDAAQQTMHYADPDVMSRLTREAAELREQRAELDRYSDGLQLLRRELMAEHARAMAEPAEARQRLEAATAELAARREEFENERRQAEQEIGLFRRHQREAGVDLARRQEQLDREAAEVSRRAEELLRSAEAEEEARRRLADQERAVAAKAAEAEAALAEVHRRAEEFDQARRDFAIVQQTVRHDQQQAASKLARQRTELDQADAALRQQQKDLEALRAGLEPLKKEREAFEAKKAAWVLETKTQARDLERRETHLARQKEAADRVEQQLNFRREELLGMMGQIRKAHQTLLSKQSPALAALQAENYSLQDRVRELEAAAHAPGNTGPAPDEPAALDRLRADLADREVELAELRGQLADLGQAHAALAELSTQVAARDARLEQLEVERDALTAALAKWQTGPGEALTTAQAQVEALKRELTARDEALEQLRKDCQAILEAKCVEDVAAYETELAAYRRHMLQDRMELSRQLKEVRERSTDLDDVIKSAEVDLARERANLARERAKLEHERQLLRMAEQKEQREGDLRLKLATVTRGLHSIDDTVK